MNNIVRKYSDSYEYTKDQLRAAINTKYSDYDFKAHYPDENIVVVWDWAKNEYYEIHYNIEDGEITIGEPQITEHDEIFITPEQINNSMKQKEPLILINEIKPTYRVLVQTGEELPGWDKGLNKIKYNNEGIKKAMPSLLGKEVWDESISSHARERGDKTKNRFAKVVNEGYCPQYGGYVDLEVHDPNYVGLMNSMIDSLNRDLPIDLGFSTELNNDYAAQKYGDNNIEVTDWTYKGLVLTDNPRDTRAKICNVINNSIPKLEEDDNVSEKIELTKEEYDALKTKEQELGELQTKYEDGEKLYNNGKKLYEDLQKEEADLRKQLVPIWTKQGEQKMEMVNSLLETIPEAEKEEKKKIFESMDVDQLGVIVNSLPEEGQRGVQGGGNPPGNLDEYSKEQFEKDYEAAYGEKP